MIPPKAIPDDLWDAFTMGGKIRVLDWYINSSDDGTRPIFYSKDQINALIRDVRDGKTNSYGVTNQYLYTMLDRYGIGCKTVAVMGSVVPWYEAICLSRGAWPVTVEYNTRNTDHPALKTMLVNDFFSIEDRFDAVVSISSFEHDGLGRYGDPVCPDADLRVMNQLRNKVFPGGLLFLAVPIGVDTLVWNAHRIYGRIRFPKLIEGWSLIDSSGFHDSQLDRDMGKSGGHQPVFVLQNN